MKAKCHDCCTSDISHAASCGCCAGVSVLTPLAIYNRPGLALINYRIGTHGSFLETMTARLTGYFLENTDNTGNVQKKYPLQGLSTRKVDDPAIAILDAWATVADVLTFYQERIASEGYLRTATERRSILEMAGLVGYKPRPGVSASVFLAFTLDENFNEPVVIPSTSRVQSMPGPDEFAQTFETSEDLTARAQWNNLKPRVSRPQTKASIDESQRLYLKGLNTNLKLNDPLLIGVGDFEPELHWVKAIRPDADNDRTLILLEKKVVEMPFLSMTNIFSVLTLPPSIPPSSSRKLTRDISEIFNINKSPAITSFANPINKYGAAEASHAALKAFAPQLKKTLAPSLSNANVNAMTGQKVRVYALRVKAAPFAHNAPLQPVRMNEVNVMRYSEWAITNPLGSPAPNASFRVNAGGSPSIQFINNSTGYIDSVNWDFGDGSISGAWSPVHDYVENETYTVTLTVIGPGGKPSVTETFNVLPTIG